MSSDTQSNMTQNSGEDNFTLRWYWYEVPVILGKTNVTLGREACAAPLSLSRFRGVCWTNAQLNHKAGWRASFRNNRNGTNRILVRQSLIRKDYVVKECIHVAWCMYLRTDTHNWCVAPSYCTCLSINSAQVF